MENEVEKIVMGGMEFPARKSMDWEEQFRMMKRWYYRLRKTQDFFSLDVSYREDFFIAFFITCDHFGEWLIRDGIAGENEIKEYKEAHDDLQLCREITNFSKHAELWLNHKDPKTEVVGRRVLVIPPTGPLYQDSVLKIKSPGRKMETHDALELVLKCLNIWRDFLIFKKLKIPDMPEEYMFEKFTKWEPDSLQSSTETGSLTTRTVSK